ncbi:MAG: asparagine synthetase B [Polaribacter sp. BACL8 MAG-120531-bin13]|jgi:hypothetical protein|nr:MAG: asparagine synthetase B [Polaribacter sp. BACL8 MAG-120531-bin13]KRP02372.1 MAG: asparagine synthetase B [Polaribacter sp. BACL8 MAG-120619-bin41]
MKTNLFYSLCLFSLLWSSNLSAQDFGKLDASPMDIAWFPAKHMDANKKMRVIYNRPQLKSRSLSTLAPNGAIWRTGANEASEITFYQDVVFGGENVKAGTYALFTIPGENSWTIILNSNLNQWGSYSYDEKADVLRVKAIVSEDSEALEYFSMVFHEENDNLQLSMGWNTTRVHLPISMQ